MPSTTGAPAAQSVTRTKGLRREVTDAIARDMLRERSPSSVHTISCLTCGAGFVRRGPTGDDQFCSARCHEGFDAGLGPHDRPRVSPYEATYRRAAGGDPGYLPRPMKLGRRGFLIDCAGCGQQFESLGRRCCSVECERAARERQQAAAVMVEAGLERAAKRKCEAPDCDRDIPNWRNGRRVSKATRFCSVGCSRRVARNTQKCGEGV